MGPADNQITSIPGTAVMFVEVSYRYQPLVSQDILPIPATIRRESAFNVRGRQNNGISNAQDLAVQSCS